MFLNYRLLSLIFIFCVTVSCKKDDPTEPTTDYSELKKSIVSNYADIIYASYKDSYDKAVILKSKIEALVSTPSASALTEAQTAWLEARIPYLQTEAYRFYGGPIDDTDGPEGLLNAWPMDEAYIDYVDGNASAGIINAPTTYPTIDKALIESLNEQGGETNISAGYHAIEFLLWGQDLNPSGAGQRPYTDYVTSGGTASNQARRGQYLIAVADLLLDNLQGLVDEWKPGVSNYRTAFIAAPVDESLQKILLGMGSLSGGELAGERMQVAYNTQLQEDEHSCFSDNTHNDIVLDAKGIENVYYGRYTKGDGTTIDGAGIDELVSKINSTRNTEMVQRLSTTKSAVEAIQPPFDQEITDTNGRARILAAIQSLQSQANKIVEVASALGITLVL
jgi:putative iron-regulated protein